MPTSQVKNQSTKKADAFIEIKPQNELLSDIQTLVYMAGNFRLGNCTLQNWVSKVSPKKNDGFFTQPYVVARNEARVLFQECWKNKEDQAKAHLCVAYTLLDNGGFFDVLRHLNKGYELIKSKTEKEAVQIKDMILALWVSTAKKVRSDACCLSSQERNPYGEHGYQNVRLYFMMRMSAVPKIYMCLKYPSWLIEASRGDENTKQLLIDDVESTVLYYPSDVRVQILLSYLQVNENTYKMSILPDVLKTIIFDSFGTVIKDYLQEQSITNESLMGYLDQLSTLRNDLSDPLYRQLVNKDKSVLESKIDEYASRQDLANLLKILAVFVLGGDDVSPEHKALVKLVSRSYADARNARLLQMEKSRGTGTYRLISEAERMLTEANELQKSMRELDINLRVMELLVNSLADGIDRLEARYDAERKAERDAAAAAARDAAKKEGKWSTGEKVAAGVAVALFL